DDDGLDLSVDDFFLSGSSSDEAEPKCKVWHNPGALLENIIYPRAYTYEHQYNMLLDLASKMNEEPFRLLIVDYVITLLCVRLVLTSLEEDNLQSARASGAPECCSFRHSLYNLTLLRLFYVKRLNLKQDVKNPMHAESRFTNDYTIIVSWDFTFTEKKATQFLRPLWQSPPPPFIENTSLLYHENVSMSTPVTIMVGKYKSAP
ncbi:meiotic recombination protein DMC1, partial [Tanacetum coccineum]